MYLLFVLGLFVVLAAASLASVLLVGQALLESRQIDVEEPVSPLIRSRGESPC